MPSFITTSDLNDLKETFGDACRGAATSATVGEAEALQSNFNFATESLLSQYTAGVSNGTIQERESCLSSLHSLLTTLVEFFHYPLPNVEEVLELAVTELLPHILACHAFSSQISQDVRQLMSYVASTSHPRDTVTLFLGQMHAQ